MMYIESSAKVDFVCGNCLKEASFWPSLLVVSDRDGYHYLVTPDGDRSRLQVVDIKYEDYLNVTENKNIPDMMSVKCPSCGTFSAFAIARATIKRYVNGEFKGIMSVTKSNGANELPIVLLQRLADEGFQPLCIMGKFVNKE